jgi:hypothetical protein
LRIREITNSQELDLRKIRNFANVRKVTNRQKLTPSTTLKCAHMDQLYRVTDEKPLMLYLAYFFVRFEWMTRQMK